MNRSNVQILYDMLHFLEDKNGTRRTAIMYRVNLSHDMLVRYLQEAQAFGFMFASEERYFLTEKGRLFIEKMKEIGSMFVPEKEGIEAWH